MKSGQGAEKGYESAFGRGLLRAGRGIAVAAVGIVVAARVALAAVAPGDGGLVDQMPKSVAEPSKAAAARALFADRGSFVRELTAPHARTHASASIARRTIRRGIGRRICRWVSGLAPDSLGTAKAQDNIGKQRCLWGK